jgi:hypothetical protein
MHVVTTHDNVCHNEHAHKYSMSVNACDLKKSKHPHCFNDILYNIQIVIFNKEYIISGLFSDYNEHAHKYSMSVFVLA